MNITKADLIWNYAATFLKVSSSVLLLPLILNKMPTETVGIWSVFMTLTAFSTILDFGFSSSFTRNVTYTLNGVRNLKKNGFENLTEKSDYIDYGLLKGLIEAMRWFYLRVALVLFILIASIGTFYILTIIRTYQGNREEVYVAWIILCLISTYNLYTMYYDSLLLGKGLIKRSKQIQIVGQCLYLLFAATLIISGYGLIAIVFSQLLSVIVIRYLSYKSFFNKEIRDILSSVQARPVKEIVEAIYPNSIKIGLTSLGGFLVQRSAIVIGSLFISLDKIASYGITMQIVSVISILGLIYSNTYQPEIVKLRVTQSIDTIKELYVKSEIFLILTYLICGILFLTLGNFALELIDSKTELLPLCLIFLALLVSFLESNHSNAGNILLTKNEVPFFKASIISGIVTVILLVLLLKFSKFGIIVLIIAPGIVQGAYQNWKWPKVLINELDLTMKDVRKIISKPFNRIL